MLCAFPTKVSLTEESGKSKNQPGEVSFDSLAEHLEPDLFTQLNKGLAAKVENGCNQINCQMIVEELEAG